MVVVWRVRDSVPDCGIFKPVAGGRDSLPYGPAKTVMRLHVPPKECDAWQVALAVDLREPLVGVHARRAGTGPRVS